MEIQSYKCPNCGGGLVFDPKTQKFKCEYCLSAFTEEALKEMEEAARKSEEASKPGEMPEAEKIESQKQAESKMVLYTCPSCGAEIVAQETTASTYCCYCHNPVVLSGSLDGKYRPDGLIPFEIDKKKAKEIFKNWIQKKKYVPDDFYSPRQMEYLEGIYYPYWMYSCQVSGEMQAEALRKRVTVAGEIEYIETSRYHLEKKAELPIKDVARNALKQADRSLAETVLPFDMKKLRPFQEAIFWDLGRSGATGKRKNLHRRLSRRSSSIRENPCKIASPATIMWIFGTIGRPSRGKNGTMPCFRCG